ncbi:MAG TPA: ComEA family DNA-binding protein [Calditerricola sp.]
MREWLAEWTTRERRLAVAVTVLAAAVLSLFAYILWGEKRETTWVAAPSDMEAADPTLNGSGEPQGGQMHKAEAASPREPVKTVIVDVKGAVNRPGVVMLPEGSRVQDAVRAAGGLAPNADVERVNLAAPLADGMAVVIPRRGENPPSVGDPVLAGAAQGEKVDLNRATAAELDALPGLGPSKAAAIVKYREEKGPFRAVEDLLDVPGIGPALLEQLRDHVVVR